MAVYAVIRSLRKIAGCVSSCIGFSDNTVFDIVRQDERLTPEVQIIPDGGTYCGGALMQALIRFSTRPEARKIVIMMTDGETSDVSYFREVIESARTNGIELVGIGIVDDHIKHYLRPNECCVINDLTQMIPELFRILRGKLLGES